LSFGTLNDKDDDDYDDDLTVQPLPKSTRFVLWNLKTNNNLNSSQLFIIDVRTEKTNVQLKGQNTNIRHNNVATKQKYYT
jgi:hypothetical protein